MVMRSSEEVVRKIELSGGEVTRVSRKAERIAKSYGIPVSKVEEILDASASIPRVLIRASEIGLDDGATSAEMRTAILKLYEASTTTKRAATDDGWTSVDKLGDGLDELTQKVAEIQRENPDATVVECVKEAHRRDHGLWARVTKAQRARNSVAAKSDLASPPAMVGDAVDELSKRVDDIQTRAWTTRGRQLSQAEAAQQAYAADPSLFGRVRHAQRLRNRKGGTK